MICKFCFAEIEEEASVCPVCGKELTQEQTPAEEIAEESAEVSAEEIAETAEEEILPTAKPKKKPKKKMPVAVKVVLASLCVIVLALLLTYAILVSTEGTEATMARLDKITHSLKFWRENDLNYKLSYTVEDNKAENKANEIVATLGDQTLTNGELQAAYWLGVIDFLNNYNSYLSMMGLDVSKPLDEQVYDPETGMTFQQMFLEGALNNWRRYATLVQLSQEAGFTLNEVQEAYLTGIRTELEEMAKENNYTDLEKFIDEEFFPGSSLEAYMQYNRRNQIAFCYYDSVYQSFIPTQEEIEAYYEANKATLEENGYGKDAGNYYDVRHILIYPESATGSTTQYTDAEWEACREKAQKILDEYLAGETVDEQAFATLAAKHSADTGSSSNGGLYAQLTTKTNFVTSFKDWYLDENRKMGDTGLVKSEYGYHIMYFSGTYPIWQYQSQDALVMERSNSFIAAGEEKWPMSVNYKKIVLGQMDLAG